jgi:hypothetical protein
LWYTKTILLSYSLKTQRDIICQGNVLRLLPAYTHIHTHTHTHTHMEFLVREICNFWLRTRSTSALSWRRRPYGCMLLIMGTPHVIKWLILAHLNLERIFRCTTAFVRRSTSLLSGNTVGFFLLFMYSLTLSRFTTALHNYCIVHNSTT